MNPNQIAALLKIAADYYQAMEQLTVIGQQLQQAQAAQKKAEDELAALKNVAV